MGLGTADLDYYLLRGGVPPSAASLTGDLSAMEKALVARILQSTSPGLTRNKAGSMGEQLQYLIDIIDNTVAPGDTSLSSGSIAAMIKYLIANPGGGSAFSELGSLGKSFPYTNGSTTDLTINGADQTVAPTNGVLRYRTITFTTAHVLRITASPCILMVDTIVWNAAGRISCEASGAPALGANPTESFPRGGRIIDTADVIGGYGGGFLVVLAGTINGSTTGTIRANGTDGNRNTSNAGAVDSRAGEGGLSASYSPVQVPTGTMAGEMWASRLNASGVQVGPPPGSGAHLFLPTGDISASGQNDGGSGGGAGVKTAVSSAGGGSGTGAGGGCGGGGGTTPAALVSANLVHVLDLIRLACRGGGAGACVAHTTGTNNCAGGGGGGLVCLVVDVETQVSTLTAAGGNGVGTNGHNGGAGITLRQVI